MSQTDLEQGPTRSRFEFKIVRFRSSSSWLKLGNSNAKERKSVNKKKKKNCWRRRIAKEEKLLLKKKKKSSWGEP